MSIQWTVVASFLYAEIAVVLLLMIPFISPKPVIRRLVTLICAQALLLAVSEAPMKQAQSATEAAQPHLKKSGDSANQNNEGNVTADALEKEVKELKSQLEKARKDLHHLTSYSNAPKVQAENLSKEHDRLCDELAKVQQAISKIG
ncbi:B-cell receptor-associated protein 31-like [Haemaphysalis longicornis]